MSNSPFAHSHDLHIIIPTAAANESVPQTSSERAGPHSASFTNPDVVRGPKSDPVNAHVQQDAATHSHVLTHSHALTAAPSTPAQRGVEGVPPTPVSPRAPRRATRTSSLFSAGDDHGAQEDDGKGDFIAEAAMMLGVMAGHLVARYLGHEEPSSKKAGHDDDEKD